jgi:hypothetical protein
MCFAGLKTHRGFERLRLCGLFGARDELHLPAIRQNLKTMALRLLGPSLNLAAGHMCAPQVQHYLTPPPPARARIPNAGAIVSARFPRVLY